MDFAPVRSFAIRHRFAVRNWSLILVGALVAIYWAYAVDIFYSERGIGLYQAEIELDEALLMGAPLALPPVNAGAS